MELECARVASPWQIEGCELDGCVVVAGGTYADDEAMSFSCYSYNDMLCEPLACLHDVDEACCKHELKLNWAPGKVRLDW